MHYPAIFLTNANYAIFNALNEIAKHTNLLSAQLINNRLNNCADYTLTCMVMKTCSRDYHTPYGICVPRRHFVVLSLSKWCLKQFQWADWSCATAQKSVNVISPLAGADRFRKWLKIASYPETGILRTQKWAHITSNDLANNLDTRLAAHRIFVSADQKRNMTSASSN